MEGRNATANHPLICKRCEGKCSIVQTGLIVKVDITGKPDIEFVPIVKKETSYGWPSKRTLKRYCPVSRKDQGKYSKKVLFKNNTVLLPKKTSNHIYVAWLVWQVDEQN